MQTGSLKFFVNSRRSDAVRQKTFGKRLSNADERVKIVPKEEVRDEPPKNAGRC